MDTYAKQMPTISPEIPAANRIAAEAAGFEAPKYDAGAGYFTIRKDDGTYHRFERIPHDRLATGYKKPAEAAGRADTREESHSTTFERLLNLSHRIILYVENSIVHSKPRPVERELLETPEVMETRTVKDGVEIKLADGTVNFWPKLPTAVKHPQPQ